jgi:exopolysaccharide biosynthesis polyprenyl glycosylphosphotransferase
VLRLGIHYVEPRRIAFFVLEESALWLSFVLAGGAVAHALGRPAPLEGLLGSALLATLLIEGGIYLHSLHDLRVALDDAADGRLLLKVLGGSTILFAFVGARSALSPSTVAGLGASCVAVLALRAALPSLSAWLGLQTRVFLVGEGATARQLVREAQRHGGVDVAGFAGVRTLGIAERAAAVDARIIVVAADDRRGLPTYELLRCRAEGLEVIEGATFAARALHRLPIELTRPSDLIFHDGFAHPLWLRATRRGLSIATSSLLLLLSAPLLAVAALAVRLDSRGPVLFRQLRTGRRGLPFPILKFRTMTVDAERDGAAWATAGDPRITRVGRWLRRFRVDELPQLWNVLRGDMDLVGPRPERPEFVTELRRKIPYYDLRTVVRPGITGWAQVKYPYAASVEEAREKLQYDLYYVRHLSLSLDLLVLALTAKVVIGGRGAR